MKKLEASHLLWQRWLIIAGFVILCAMMLQNYLITIFLAVMFGVLLHPVHKRLTEFVSQKSIAALLTILLLVLVIVIPTIVLGTLTGAELFRASADLAENITAQETEITTAISDTLDYVNNYLPESSQITLAGISERLASVVEAAAGVITNNTLRIGSAAILAITDALLFLTILWSVLMNYEQFKSYMSKISPFNSELDSKLGGTFYTSSRNLLISIFFVAFLQALSVWLLLKILNIPYAFLIAVVSFILSVVPLGSGFVMFPLGLGLMLTGNVAAGIIVILFVALITTNIDNVVRPMLAAGGSELNFTLLLIGILGGVSLLGFWGVIIGPIILEFTFILLKEYQSQS